MSLGNSTTAAWLLPHVPRHAFVSLHMSFKNSTVGAGGSNIARAFSPASHSPIQYTAL